MNERFVANDQPKSQSAHVALHNMFKKMAETKSVVERNQRTLRAQTLQLKEKGKQLYYQEQYAQSQLCYEDARLSGRNLADFGPQTEEDKVILSQVCLNLAILARRKQKWELCFQYTVEALKLQPDYEKAQKIQDIAFEAMNGDFSFL